MFWKSDDDSVSRTGTLMIERILEKLLTAKLLIKRFFGFGEIQQMMSQY